MAMQVKHLTVRSHTGLLIYDLIIRCSHQNKVDLKEGNDVFKWCFSNTG